MLRVNRIITDNVNSRWNHTEAMTLVLQSASTMSALLSLETLS